MKSLDEKILELVDDENEEESIKYDVTEVSEIRDKITWALVRIDSTLKSLQINSPELEMKTFNGRPTEWQAVIECFDGAVHSNPKLGNIDKMNYLKSLIEGPAAEQSKGCH